MRRSCGYSTLAEKSEAQRASSAQWRGLRASRLCRISVPAPAVRALRHAGFPALAVIRIGLAVAAANRTEDPRADDRFFRACAGHAEAGTLAWRKLAELSGRTLERQDAAATLRLGRGLRAGNEQERGERKQDCEPTKSAQHGGLPWLHAFSCNLELSWFGGQYQGAAAARPSHRAADTDPGFASLHPGYARAGPADAHAGRQEPGGRLRNTRR